MYGHVVSISVEYMCVRKYIPCYSIFVRCSRYFKTARLLIHELFRLSLTGQECVGAEVHIQQSGRGGEILDIAIYA
jgi:hypothetical protein